jgi:hypothetical protein
MRAWVALACKVQTLLLAKLNLVGLPDVAIRYSQKASAASAIAENSLAGRFSENVDRIQDFVRQDSQIPEAPKLRRKQNRATRRNPIYCWVAPLKYVSTPRMGSKPPPVRQRGPFRPL